ncbi:type VI secretion system membrane subunit TssM [Thalassococcus sp. S3]|uniref:type VI secretion system membrane subunit TssM n=1 Tax=Thalassococcus sp. S3 TaxID=2017482 RepID=UPI0010242E67|nr:type VI secretion system membrane subunit TssM [Thalassococcus sp. S3]QBF32481.1 type VI secretion protein IcmF [Thalassococcus sp. S3]
MNPLGLWTNLRSQIDSYASVVGPRFIALIWVGAICAIIWIFGPRLTLFGDQPLAPVPRRLIAIAIVLGIWAIWSIISWWRQRRAGKALEDAVAESPEDRAASETKAEIAELRDRLSAAMKMMRKLTKRPFGYAYEYPWYLMMGAPGAGKTTLLTKSGLRFPLGDALRAEPVQGVGGTRNCNWWFADRAILIDTAGRYTTQDTGQERDSAGFLGFLSMLRRKRRAQPINGVLLTLSLTDLLTQPPEDRLREIRAIRQRLSEIEETLGARIPVYMVLTKADKLTGFGRFFDSLGAQARKQVWGITFPYDEAQEPGRTPDIFSREYQALLVRLNAMLVERLQQETDIDQRGRIFRFPAQVSALHDALREIVEELSSGSANVAEPLLRGIYFASATQDEAANVAPRGVPQAASAMNRTYFVERLFTEVILGEAALISRDSRVSRRQKIATGLGYGFAACAAIFLATSWTAGFAHNRQALNQIDGQLASYEQRAQNIPIREIEDTDFLRVLPALETLARTPAAFEEAGAGPVPLHRVAFGMDRSNRIENAHAGTYAEALGAYLLPRYLVALQNRLKDPEIEQAEAFETLKHYLSLAGLGPIDRDGLLAQAERIFLGLYPDEGRAPTRETLMGHMEAMLDKGRLPILAIDEQLVAETRETIADRGPALRVLDLLADRPAARALPDWSVTAAIGPSARAAFGVEARAIDGLLTREGYYSVVLPQIGPLSEVAAGEGWVRGPGGQISATPSEISVDAVELYWQQFAAAWRGAVSDISIAQAGTLSEAADLVSLVSAEADPIGRLAASIAEQSDLVSPPGGGLVMNAASLPFDLLAAPDPYAPLRRALSPQGEDDGPLAALTPILDAVYTEITRLDTRDPSAAEALASETALSDAAQALVAEGRQMPQPVDGWVVSLAARVTDAAVGQARAEANRLWQAQGAGQCRRSVEGRYPFFRASSTDVTLTDFTQTFGPSGLFASFFSEHLADFVDTTRDPWRWRGGLGLEDADTTALAQFQRADAIRRAFFPAGSETPRVEIALDLIELDPEANVVLVEIGSARTAHRRELASDEGLSWPPEGGVERARIMLLPGGRASALSVSGPWAPYRLFERARVEPVSDNQFNAFFTVDGRAVALRVTSGSVNNPFRLEALTAFRCPEQF